MPQTHLLPRMIASRSTSEATMLAAADNAGTTSVSAVHPDVLLAHILSLLDGPTLAATSCASSHLHALISSDDNLWRDICRATWPSVADARMRRLLAAFPAGHRSFFSDSFPLLHHRAPKCNPDRSSPSPPPSELISAVDIHYKGELVFSKVVETKTASSDWFGSAPFRVDLVEGDQEQSGVIRVPARFGTSDGTCRRDLEENLTLSWIMVDPARNRAARVSSRKAVSVRLRAQWARSMMSATGDDDVEVQYATVVAGGGKRGSATELVEVAVAVRCMGKEGGEVQVRGASVRVEDMDGRSLSGEESLVILGEAMGSGERRKGSSVEEREGYEELMEMKRKRRERRERREMVGDMACMAFGFSIFFALWCFLLFR